VDGLSLPSPPNSARGFLGCNSVKRELLRLYMTEGDEAPLQVQAA